MQGQFGKKKENEEKETVPGVKKETVRRPHANAMSEGPMLISEGQKIEKKAREQNEKSVKTELEAILSRFKRKRRKTIEKKKDKRISDDSIPPDGSQDGSGDGESGNPGDDGEPSEENKERGA